MPQPTPNMVFLTHILDLGDHHVVLPVPLKQSPAAGEEDTWAVFLVLDPVTHVSGPIGVQERSLARLVRHDIPSGAADWEGGGGRGGGYTSPPQRCLTPLTQAYETICPPSARDLTANMPPIYFARPHHCTEPRSVHASWGAASLYSEWPLLFGLRAPALGRGNGLCVDVAERCPSRGHVVFLLSIDLCRRCTFASGYPPRRSTQVCGRSPRCERTMQRDSTVGGRSSTSERYRWALETLRDPPGVSGVSRRPCIFEMSRAASWAHFRRIPFLTLLARLHSVM